MAPQMEMRPRLIDSHCHLLEPEFASDMNDVIESAKARGILIINSAISPASWEACIRMASTNPSVYASIGLDPMLYDQAQSAVDFITEHAGGIVSVGECGIDHFRATDHSERKMQEDAFRILVRALIATWYPCTGAFQISWRCGFGNTLVHRRAARAYACV